MKAKLVVTSFAALSIVSCKSLDNFAGSAQGKLDEANSKFSSFDLTCEYRDITESTTDDKGVAPVAGVDDKGGAIALTVDDKGGAKPVSTNKCEKAKEYYSMLLKKFDADKDGKLSAAELEKGRGEFEQEKLRQLDKNKDGIISETEKAEWRAKELPASEQKLVQELQASGVKVSDDKGVKGVSDVRREDRREDRGAETELADDKGGLRSADDSGHGRGRGSDDHLSRRMDD